MNVLLAAVVVALLALLVVGWLSIIRYWQGKGLDVAKLRLRQRRVRIWTGVACCALLAGTMIYWRLLASGTAGRGPSFFLIPLGAIVSLLGVIAVRGLWFLALSPIRGLRWLNSSSYRVALQAGFVGIVSFITVFDLNNLVDSSTLILLSFAIIATLVALGSLVIGLLHADPQDYTDTSLPGQAGTESMEIARRSGARQDGSVSVLFDWPAEIRISCAQYVLYFGQFLKDVGVNVQTALTEEAGLVLFSVTPADEKEALHKIRDALDLYLKLAYSPINDAADESIAAQRLEATILRFKADLKLAAAEIQTKNATIQAKDATIKYQQFVINAQAGLLTGEILVDSLKEVTPKPDDPEDLIPDIIALGTFEAKGVKVHLGELLRRLKALFAKKESTSV